MAAYRYDMSGNWYKGNTHIHSTASDGEKTFAEIAALYATGGYDFLFRTDHWVTSTADAEDNTAPLLWLDGIELDGDDDTGAYYHVVCLGTHAPITREMGFMAALESARAQGCLRILAHPFWTGNTLEDAVRWSFDGVELYNNVCRYLNGKYDGMIHWGAMLRQQPATLAFAADDAHLWPDFMQWNGGWIVVNAPACTREALLPAIRAGNFYSSRGPSFEVIAQQGNQLTLRTSPVVTMRVISEGYRGLQAFGKDALLTEASFTIPPEWPFAYVEIEDEAGNCAWTNTLLPPYGEAV